MDKLTSLCARLGMTLLAFAVLMLMLAIVVQVLCSAFNVNPIASFSRPLPVIGPSITLNSLLDAQWHLLVLIALLPVGLVWLQGKHVRVDFLYNTCSERKKAAINFVGNLLFAAPFFALMLPAAWAFMIRSWTSDEGSANGGLADLWLIKSILPFGLGLLALAICIETFRLVKRLR